MTYSIDYTAIITELNAKQRKLFNERFNAGLEPTEEMLDNANKFWKLAYARTKELADANCINFYGDPYEAEDWLFDVYDNGEDWPDDDDLLEALEELRDVRG